MLFYGGDVSGDAVDLFDHIEVRVGGTPFRGQVKKLHPSSREVTVQYEDHHDVARSTGEPRRKTARVSVLAVDLVRRDG